MKISDKLYDVLKWVAMICIPALVLFLNTVMPVWGVSADLTNQIVTTVAAIGTLIGSLIAVSTANYNKEVK